MNAPVGVVVLGLACIAMAAPAAARGHDLLVYAGTYTQGESKGIYRFHLDTKTGALSGLELAAETPNPSFLALHPNHHFLYAANENGDATKDAVSAFAVDLPGGALTPLNQQPSRGAAPCHLSLDSRGEHLFVANYVSGTAAIFPVGADGKLGASTGFVQHEGHGTLPNQQGPHAHAVTLDPTGRLAFVSDLGLDQIVAYRFDAEKGAFLPHTAGTTRAIDGSGPRHFIFDAKGRHAYSVNEMALTVTVFDYDAAQGTLTKTQVLTMLPPSGAAEHASAAEIALGPDGRFLYASSRGPDEIVAFRVNERDGTLTTVGRQSTLGKKPRHFAIDPTGTFLLAANQDSDSIVVFRIDRKTGLLTPVGAPFHVPRPVCVLMLPR